MKRLFSVFTFLSFLVVCFVKFYQDTYYFKLENVRFRSSKLPANATFTIVQISDLHNHVFGNDNERLIRTVKLANPDVIVLTGDLIDRRTMTFNHVFSFVERLTAINPRVFFVSGNHEWANGRTHEFLDGLHQRNIRILNNQNTRISKENLTVNIAGIDDFATEHENLNEAFRNLNSDYYTVLLSHAPGITKQYDPIPADLILSGHTHGGQIRFPFIGALLAPGQGLFPKLDRGTFPLGPDQYLYIDSGLGTTRLPIRFLNQSQLSLMTITNQTDE